MCCGPGAHKGGGSKRPALLFTPWFLLKGFDFEVALGTMLQWFKLFLFGDVLCSIVYSQNTLVFLNVSSAIAWQAQGNANSPTTYSSCFSEWVLYWWLVGECFIYGNESKRLGMEQGRANISFHTSVPYVWNKCRPVVRSIPLFC